METQSQEIASTEFISDIYVKNPDKATQAWAVY